MSVVELRWAVPAETTTQAPRLQYRQRPDEIRFGGGDPWTDWKDVPLVVVAQPVPAANGVREGGA